MKSRFLLRIEKEQKQKMADYRGGGLTNMKIREAEKLVENIRHNVEQKKKEAEGAVSFKNHIISQGFSDILSRFSRCIFMHLQNGSHRRSNKVFSVENIFGLVI